MSEINFVSFFGNKFKFLTYNFFLPLFIPLLILVGTKLIIGNFELFTVLRFIFQSVSLFLVVAFFTNIGFWTSNQMHSFEEEIKNKESFVAISLILGLISVFLFVSSFIVNDSFLVTCFISVAILFLLFALSLYYHNPLIMHSASNVNSSQGKDKDNEIIKNIQKNTKNSTNAGGEGNV